MSSTFGNQELHAEAAIPRLAEIGAHAAAQVLGFADVENRASLIFHEVDTGLRGHLREFGFKVHHDT